MGVGIASITHSLNDEGLLFVLDDICAMVDSLIVQPPLPKGLDNFLVGPAASLGEELLHQGKFSILLCTLHGTGGDVARIRYHVDVIEGPVHELQLLLQSLLAAQVRTEGFPLSGL